jgi:hypothetical protein
VAHELTYKTELKLPDDILRQSAGLAAVLEGADREFAVLVRALEEFRSNDGAHRSRSSVEAELARLQIVLSCAGGSPDLAEKIARLALSIGEHEAAAEVLLPYAGEPHRGVQRLLGLVLTENHRDRPRSREYARGRSSLEAAVSHPEKDAETLCALAETWILADETKARGLFREAAAVDPTEPVTLCRYLEFEIAHAANEDVVRLAAPMIRNAMGRWRYAETKDVKEKRSPYLVAWDQLSKEIQGFDLDAIRRMPTTFREAGLDLFRLA